MTFITKIENLFRNHALVPEATTLDTKFKELTNELENLLPDGDLKEELFTDLSNLSTKAHAIVAEIGNVANKISSDTTELETAPATVENDHPETSGGGVDPKSNPVVLGVPLTAPDAPAAQ